MPTYPILRRTFCCLLFCLFSFFFFSASRSKMYVRMPTYAILRNTFCCARALCCLIRVSLCAQDLHVDLFLFSRFHVFFSFSRCRPIFQHMPRCVFFRLATTFLILRTRYSCKHAHTLTQGAIKALKRRFAVFFF